MTLYELMDKLEKDLGLTPEQKFWVASDIKRYTDSLLFQMKWVSKAKIWKSEHQIHVKNLMDSSKGEEVEPSGSDRFYPELWKGIHWNWLETLS